MKCRSLPKAVSIKSSSHALEGWCHLGKGDPEASSSISKASVHDARGEADELTTDGDKGCLLPPACSLARRYTSYNPVVKDRRFSRNAVIRRHTERGVCLELDSDARAPSMHRSLRALSSLLSLQ